MKWILDKGKCTEGDCRALFASSKEELRWLCYTLTGDSALSDKALDAALQQSLKGASQVFREWMLSWARRLIIKFCIVTVRPSESPLALSAYPLCPVSSRALPVDDIRELLSLPSTTLQQTLMRLDALSRFVFTLRALEGYTRRDTALLLNIDDRACEWVYGWAVTRLRSDVAGQITQKFEQVSRQVVAEFQDRTTWLEFAEAI